MLAHKSVIPTPQQLREEGPKFLKSMSFRPAWAI